MLRFLSRTPSMLGEKKRHSSSGWAVTMRRFLAPCSSAGSSRASLPRKYARIHCRIGGTRRKRNRMRRVQRQRALGGSESVDQSMYRLLEHGGRQKKKKKKKKTAGEAKMPGAGGRGKESGKEREIARRPVRN